MTNITTNPSSSSSSNDLEKSVITSATSQLVPKAPSSKQSQLVTKTHFFTDDEIRLKAYELWLKRGAGSSAEENWKDAIYVLRREHNLKRIKQSILWLKWKNDLGLPTWLTVLVSPAWLVWKAISLSWRWSGIKGKSGWDFAQLLAVPLVLTLAGWGLNEYAKERDKAQQRIDEGRAIAQQQADKAREQAIADDKAKQDTLVKYLDDMAELLIGGLLATKPGDDRFIVAQAKTVIALQALDQDRQRLVMQFLKASGLNQAPDVLYDNPDEPDEFGSFTVTVTVTEKDNQGRLQWREGYWTLFYKAQMSRANLAGSDLSGSVFIEANFEKANLGCNPVSRRDDNLCSNLSRVDFRGANFVDADLSNANLNFTNLIYAEIRNANLSNAELIGANLSYAIIWEANLSNAVLGGVRLDGAQLNGANLSNAIFLSADLSNVGLELDQLTGANAPLLCRVKLPEPMKNLSDRDCDRIPQEFVNRGTYGVTNLDEAKAVMNSIR